MPIPAKRHFRRGSATLWLIIWLPCLMVLFCVLVGVANLWLARVELENALEASALAAVKQWGDAGGGDTLIPREIGQSYAAANCVRRNPVVIGLNYDPATGGPNQNDECEPTDETVSPPNGNLIFGAIDDDDPDNVIFNAGIPPACAAGSVLFDVSAQGAGNLDQDNAWGIAFLNNADTPPNLRIVRVEIDLQAGGGTGVWDFSSGGPTITDNVDPHLIEVTCANNSFSQPDMVGFTDPANQIVFSNTPSVLTIDFLPDLNPIGGTDDGFAPCDRFRFGALTTGVGAGTPQGGDDDDGDGIGSDGVQVTGYFELGGVPQPPVTGTYFDNDEKSNQCRCPPDIDPFCNSLIVHPVPIPNLPCPPASGNNNNGQSYVVVNNQGAGKFGVRAQAIIGVQPLGGFSFLGNLSQYCIQAKATAEYDCQTRRVRLIRIDEFICPGP